MKMPLDARLVLTDGPVSVFIHNDTPEEILAAYKRLGKLVQVAADQIQIEVIKNPKPLTATQMDVQQLIHRGLTLKDLS